MTRALIRNALVLGALLAACTRAGSQEAPVDRQQSGSARRIVPPDARTPPPQQQQQQQQPPRVEHIAAGKEHTCALLEGGAVRCWGMGANGRLGTAATANIGDDETPATISNIALGGRAIQLTAGSEHTCALLDTGRVRCWGAGAEGRLGYGNTRDIGDDEAPASAGDVPLDDRAISITAGSEHTCALLASGRVRCWGLNNEGQLGLGHIGRNIGSAESPGSVPALDIGTVKQLASSLANTCALLDGGAVRCWGAVVGRGEEVDDITPAAEYPLVALAVPAVSLSIGSTASHTCAIAAAGHLRCWGIDSDGELGYGVETSAVGVAPGKLPTPAELGDVLVAGRVSQAAAGGEHTCVLLETGQVRCWGAGRLGLLGPGAPAHVSAKEAIEVDVGGRVVELAAGSLHTCALLDTGRVRCWGWNQSGQLGYGKAENVGEKRSPAAAGDVPL